MTPLQVLEGSETGALHAQEVAANHQEACSAFFTDVDALCTQAADYLAQISSHVRRQECICVILTRLGHGGIQALQVGLHVAACRQTWQTSRSCELQLSKCA